MRNTRWDRTGIAQLCGILGSGVRPRSRRSPGATSLRRLHSLPRIAAAGECHALPLQVEGRRIRIRFHPSFTIPALVLVLAAAAASGRVQDTVALALLAGVGLCAVLFRVLELPEGRLVVGALALVVLVAFAWRPFAVRLTAARSAVVPAPVDRTEP